MVSAAAQGAMAVMIREDDSEMEGIVLHLEDHDAALCSGLERDFLHDMEAGCSAPVGADAFIEDQKLHFKAIAMTLDGTETYYFNNATRAEQADTVGHESTNEL